MPMKRRSCATRSCRRSSSESDSCSESHSPSTASHSGGKVCAGVAAAFMAVLALVAVLKFYSLVLVILGLDGALLGFLAYAYHAKRFEPHRISLKESMKVPDGERLKNIAFIS